MKLQRGAVLVEVLDALVASVHRRYGRPRGWWTIGQVVEATTVFEAVHVDHPDADRCYWVLPNLLPPQHGAASAYIPGIELPDELPIPTPDQVSHLPPATAGAACSATGLAFAAAPLRSAHVRCAAQRGSCPRRPRACGLTRGANATARRSCWRSRSTARRPAATRGTCRWPQARACEPRVSHSASPPPCALHPQPSNPPARYGVRR